MYWGGTKPWLWHRSLRKVLGFTVEISYVLACWWLWRALAGLWSRFSIYRACLDLSKAYHLYPCVLEFCSYHFSEFLWCTRIYRSFLPVVLQIFSEAIERKCFHIFYLLVLMGQSSLKHEVTHHSHSDISSLNSFSVPEWIAIWSWWFATVDVTILGVHSRGLTFDFWLV